MSLVFKWGNWLLYIGLLISCFGLLYVLGISNRIEFKYASGIGLIMIATSVLLSAFQKKNK